MTATILLLLAGVTAALALVDAPFNGLDLVAALLAIAAIIAAIHGGMYARRR